VSGGDQGSAKGWWVSHGQSASLSLEVANDNCRGNIRILTDQHSPKSRDQYLFERVVARELSGDWDY